MAAYLLDSDAFIDWLNKIPRSLALFEELVGRRDVFCVCDVVIAEVYAGLSAAEASEADYILDACEFLTTDAHAAKLAGAWRYQFARQGIALATTDVLVAATANAHNVPVLTGNVRHYPMPEVSLLPLPR